MLTFFYLSISAVSVFLILLILIQRGKGGGLAGAFGGAGGQSAFGTKAGDMFTKVTAGTAILWIALCMSATWYMGHSRPDLIGDNMGGEAAVEGAGDAEIGATAEGAATEDAAEGDAPVDDAAVNDAPADESEAPAEESAAPADPPAEEGN
jgi:preprotein translocase subunit SecG